MTDDDLRSRRRAAARRHHPDVGGDVDAFIRAMGDLSTPPTRSSGDVVITLSTRSRIKRTLTTTRRNLATRIGRRVPWSKPERFGRL